ncbi:S1 RNA-binding domain-containing protein, partial [Candidatus Falkowbacteria bacterium]|nr:S1 RNA-binding domain-containing protein [Candidatus Falkowbacteria bacterium]
GTVTAITNFGVFVSFGDDSIEGLIHISELAWQRIDSPNELHNVGDKIKAEIISIDGAKVFLSAKKLMKDPWLEASAKYKVGQVVPGTVLKVNPFGLFVKLDEEIHGLAHISQLEMEGKEKIAELYKADDVIDFEIVSISPSEHRLGLKFAEDKKAGAKTTKKTSKKEDEVQEEKVEEKVEEEKVEVKEKKKTKNKKTEADAK